MANPAYHLFAGTATGALVTAPLLYRAWRNGKNVSRPFRKWLLLSYAVGLFAAVPNILSLAGLPDGFCSGWWMNLFLFHPLIDRFEKGGMLIGITGITALFSMQYLLLLTAIARASRFRKEPSG